MSGKYIEMNVRFWYDDEQLTINMATKDGSGFITTINREPANPCGHPNLFNKLAKCLRDADKPAPSPT